IDRGADVKIGAGCLSRPATGEKRSIGTSMVAGAVAARLGVDVIQARDDLDLVFNRRERFHRGGELEVLSVALWPPLFQIHAVWHGNESHPLGHAARGLGSGRRGPGPARQERGKRWQGHACSDAAQKTAATYGMMSLGK